MARIKLNKEEKDLLDTYERGEWKSVKNIKEEIEKHRGYARQTLKKDQRVNIRISSMVLDEIEDPAASCRESSTVRNNTDLIYAR